jgi:hypothetical protein
MEISELKLTSKIPVVNFPYKSDQCIYDYLAMNILKAKDFSEEFDEARKNLLKKV